MDGRRPGLKPAAFRRSLQRGIPNPELSWFTAQERPRSDRVWKEDCAACVHFVAPSELFCLVRQFDHRVQDGRNLFPWQENTQIQPDEAGLLDLLAELKRVASDEIQGSH